jgi:hypothetical protein
MLSYGLFSYPEIGIEIVIGMGIEIDCDRDFDTDFDLDCVPPQFPTAFGILTAMQDGARFSSRSALRRSGE